MTLQLKFKTGNAKLKGIAIFDLPAGHTCPFASLCLSSADKVTGKITDGAATQFRCYAASAEAAFKNTRLARWHNYDLLKGKTTAEMVDLITASLPKFTSLVRIHSSGGFFSMAYFEAWLAVARQNPTVTFYAYTKAVALWLRHLGNIPANLRLTASEGGTHDALIARHGLKSARVVYSHAEAEALGLEIDHDDSHAYASDASFALLIHGTQPKGTKAAEAWKVVKATEGGLLETEACQGCLGCSNNTTITTSRKIQL